MMETGVGTALAIVRLARPRHQPGCSRLLRKLARPTDWQSSIKRPSPKAELIQRTEDGAQNRR